MKVEVTLKMKTNPAADSTLQVAAGPSDTVAALKERLAGVLMLPFPQQDLSFNGEALPDGSKLSACGVRDGAALELAVAASQATLAQQLKELLATRALSADELGLLYCYKHGVAVGQALKMLGYDGKLQDFLAGEKAFFLEGGRVALAPEGAPRKAEEEAPAVAAPGAIPVGINDCWYSASTLLELRARLLEQRPEIYGAGGRCVGALTSAPLPRRKRVEAAPCARAAEEQEACAPPGLGDASADVDEPCSVANEQYVELLNNISSRGFNAEIGQRLADIVELVSGNLCLSVDHHVLSGSVGKGTAIKGCTDAEVVFFLKGLPPSAHDTWLPPLLKSVAGVLTENLGSSESSNDIHVSEESVRLCMKELTVDLFFSPIHASYSEVMKTLQQQGLRAGRYCMSAVAKERAQFIARQPPLVKATVRLLKWWRCQQDWSSDIARPSDEILELMAVYSAVQTKPKDQRMAIANVMSLFSRFNEMRIVWSNFYSKDDVWAPLLRQRPLLMDPACPFVNVAAPEAFEPRELMELAQSTHFFW